LGRTARRQHAEQDAGHQRRSEPCQHRPIRRVGRESRIQLANHRGTHLPQTKTNQGAGQGQHASFGQKQQADIAARSAQRFEQTDFRGALGDRHQHDIHYQNARHSQADGGYSRHAQCQRAQQAVEGGQHGILRNDGYVLLALMARADDVCFKLRVDMRHEIKKLHRELNATCIYVTHDQTEAMTMASRIVVFNEGRILQVGTPRMVYDHPNSIVCRQFSWALPHEFYVCIDAQCDFTIATCNRLELPMPTIMQSSSFSPGLVVGIRPEHLKLSLAAEKNSFEVKIDRIDDMGADRLINAVTVKSGEQVMVRVANDEPVAEGRAFINMDYSKASCFVHKVVCVLEGGNA
jgi:hypothetical protein